MRLGLSNCSDSVCTRWNNKNLSLFFMVFFWGVDQIEAIKSNSFRRSRTQSGSGAPARASGSKITFDVELGSVIAYRELAREIERERESDKRRGWRDGRSQERTSAGSLLRVPFLKRPSGTESGARRAQRNAAPAPLPANSAGSPPFVKCFFLFTPFVYI